MCWIIVAGSKTLLLAHFWTVLKRILDLNTTGGRILCDGLTIIDWVVGTIRKTFLLAHFRTVLKRILVKCGLASSTTFYKTLSFAVSMRMSRF